MPLTQKQMLVLRFIAAGVVTGARDEHGSWQFKCEGSTVTAAVTLLSAKGLALAFREQPALTERGRKILKSHDSSSIGSN